MNNNFSNKIITLPSILIILAVLFFVSDSFYIVDQREQALVFQFGEVVKVVKKQGLHLKLPMIQRITYFDNRTLNVTADEKEVIANDQKRLIVNAFAKYKIVDPLKFYQTVRDEMGVRSRLNPIFDSSLRQVLGEVPLSALLTGERANVMKKIQLLVNSAAQSFGIDVIDVRILRADLPKENSEAIYQRMRTDREQEAKKFRAEGAERAQEIQSTADKDKKVIIAEAQKSSQIIRGEGDSTSAKIFSDSFNQDPEFFSFYRSLQAYRQTLAKEDTKMILSPNGDFLKFFSNVEGK